MNFNKVFLAQDDQYWAYFPQLQPVLSIKQSQFQNKKQDLEPTNSNFQSDHNGSTVIEFQEKNQSYTSTKEGNFIEEETDKKNQNQELFQEGTQKETEDQLKYFNQVFKKKSIRKQGRKNTNVPKFFVRVFIKYFKCIFDTEISPQQLKRFDKIQHQFTKRNTNNFNIPDLLSLLMNENKDFQLFNRKVMIKILRQKMKEEVLENPSISNNQKTYLMASKVYNIRCRSSRLMKRVQYR